MTKTEIAILNTGIDANLIAMGFSRTREHENEIHAGFDGDDAGAPLDNYYRDDCSIFIDEDGHVVEFVDL